MRNTNKNAENCFAAIVTTLNDLLVNDAKYLYMLIRQLYTCMGL